MVLSSIFTVLFGSYILLCLAVTFYFLLTCVLSVPLLCSCAPPQPDSRLPTVSQLFVGTSPAFLRLFPGPHVLPACFMVWPPFFFFCCLFFIFWILFVAKRFCCLFVLITFEMIGLCYQLFVVEPVCLCFCVWVLFYMTMLF